MFKVGLQTENLVGNHMDDCHGREGEITPEKNERKRLLP